MAARLLYADYIKSRPEKYTTRTIRLAMFVACFKCIMSRHGISLCIEVITVTSIGPQEFEVSLVVSFAVYDGRTLTCELRGPADLDVAENVSITI